MQRPHVELSGESGSKNWQYPNDQAEKAIEDPSVQKWVCELLKADWYPTRKALVAALLDPAFGLDLRSTAQRLAKRSLDVVQWARTREQRMTTGSREKDRRPGLYRVVQTLRAERAKHAASKGVVLPEQALDYDYRNQGFEHVYVEFY